MTRNILRTLVVLSSLTLGGREAVVAQTSPPPKVHFLFQSAVDKNKFKLVMREDVNVLYLNEKCQSCFQKIGEIQRLGGRRNFIVVTATRNWNQFEKLIPKGPTAELLYHDPGRRFETAAKLGNAEAGFLRISNGKIAARLEFKFTGTPQDPYRAGIWK